LLWLIA